MPPVLDWLLLSAAPLKPLGHHELLLLLLQLALLLLVARSLGELMRRWHQPQVIGELLAGVLLGPSVFGAALPQLQAQFFPASQTQANLLSAISWLGVLFLLLVTGLETDLNLIIRKGKTALLVSLGGILIPFASGLVLGWQLPERFLANPNERLVFGLFMATAMSISAIPVIAKVLMDLRLIRRDIGQITLAAGMTDDTIGWILLSVVAGLASGGKFSPTNLLTIVGAAVIFLAVALTIGRVVVEIIFRWVDNNIGGQAAHLSTLLVLALGASALTHHLGLEAALGAFVVGILVGQAPRFSRAAGHTLELITASFLAPIFFASAGLKVNLLQMLNPATLAVGILVLGIACLGKFTGAYLGARLGGLGHWEGLSLGAGMNARGAMEIIVATIGLSLGVLNPDMYAIIVMVAIVTSLMAPPILRWTLAKVVMGQEESQRLQAEALASQSFIKQIHRVLIPSRGGQNIQIAAQLVGFLAHQNPLEVTALSVQPESSDPEPAQILTGGDALATVTQALQLPGGKVAKAKVLRASKLKTAEVILQEAAKGYDLVVVGATETKLSGTTLFNRLVDQIVQQAACATLIVKSHSEIQAEDWQGLSQLQQILVPTTGNESSTYAVEIAATLAAQTGAIVTLLNVTNATSEDWRYFEAANPLQEITRQILNQQAELGRSFGAKVQTLILSGIPELEILKYTSSHATDLIILGSNARLKTGRAFFGQRVDAILSRAACPVAVISTAR